ncbi:MAG: Rieske (2Fe-2S) protein [Thermodesulfobacteriaceae bacterium]|nr:Rieske (2Fe-2S) protein [Thermodesulfobacteriaceae bacterium]
MKLSEEKRKFLKALFWGGMGLLFYTSLRNLTYLSKLPPKKVSISEEDLKKIQEVYIGEEFLVVKKESNFKVFSRKCPHLGCKLNFHSEKKVLLCPCHQSTFDLEGNYLTGPAKKGLFSLNFKETSQGLEIEI